MLPFGRARRSLSADERLMDLAPRTSRQSEVVNLRPGFLARHRYPAAAALVVLVIGSLAFTRFFTQASAAYFYPQSCLGTWKYVARAEGKPTASAPDQVTPADAALFTEDSQDIFCGGFAGDIPEGAAITRMQVRFSWAVTAERLRDEEKIVVPAADAPQGEESPAPDAAIDAPPATTGEFEIERIEPDGTPFEEPGPDKGPGPGAAPQEGGGSEPGTGDAGSGDGSQESSPSEGDTSFLGITVAHAQEQGTEIAEEAAAEQPAEPVGEEGADDAPETGATMTSTTDNPAIPIDIPDDAPAMTSDPGSAFLGVYFSTDGSAWTLVKNVTKDNWNEPVDLPLADWDDIARLQVKISRLQTLDKAPYVYLDGIELAAEYDDGDVMAMPDLEKDQPARVLSNERYVVIDVVRNKDARHVLWLFERGESPQWLQLADEGTMATSSALALKGANVFWVSPDGRSVTAYRADAQTSFSQTLDPRTPATYQIPFDDGRQTAAYQGSQFSFVDPATGTVGGSDDSAFSGEFWAFARSMFAATTTAQTASTTASTTLATTTEEASTIDGAAPADEDPAATTTAE